MTKQSVLLLSIFLIAATAFAQTTTGSLSETIADPSGQLIAGATVKLTNEQNGEQREGTTGTVDVLFTALAPGPASGFPRIVTLATTDNFDFSGGGETRGVVQTGSALLGHGERSFDRWFDTPVFRRPAGRRDISNNCHNYRFRGPGFNNFNHSQFDAVKTTAQFNPPGRQTNTQFGKVTSARQERRMQGSIRFTF